MYVLIREIIFMLIVEIIHNHSTIHLIYFSAHNPITSTYTAQPYIYMFTYVRRQRSNTIILVLLVPFMSLKLLWIVIKVRKDIFDVWKKFSVTNSPAIAPFPFDLIEWLCFYYTKNYHFNIFVRCSRESFPSFLDSSPCHLPRCDSVYDFVRFTLEI